MEIVFALVTTFVVLINLAAFAAFGIDKMLAEGGSQRIPEASLLTLALFGGTPGAYVGRQFFRHKTRKQPFSNALHRTAAMQVAVLAACVAGYVYW